MRRHARLGVPVVLLLAAAALAGQQTTPADPLWDRRATGAGSFQTVFEVSGRMELSIHRVSSNPQDLKSICDAQSETETAALDAARRDLQRLLAAPPRLRRARGSGVGVSHARADLRLSRRDGHLGRGVRQGVRDHRAPGAGQSGDARGDALARIVDCRRQPPAWGTGELPYGPQRRAVHLPHQPPWRASASVRVCARRRVLHQGVGAGSEEPRDALAAECRLHDARQVPGRGAARIPDPRR